MGFCMVKGMCTPVPLMWQNPKDGVSINGRLLLEDSTIMCVLGGKISIHFTRESANGVALWGGAKMPTEYIKEGFDWMAANNQKNREWRDAHLPEWMQSVAHVGDWYSDLGTGLVEGAVNGVVGLGETIYQVAQDPVGTGEALGGMVKDGWNSATTGLSNAWNWASEGENWSNAASGAWNWASDGDNWKEAAAGAWKSTQDAAGWVANNPRKIGTSVGEFIPDAAAAIGTAGGSLALTGAKVAGKEVLEEVGERVVREALGEGAEKAGKEIAEEAGEAAGIKTLRETLEALGDDTGEIAEVVAKDIDELAKEAIKKGGRKPRLPEFPVRNADGSLTDYGKWYYERPSGYRSGVRDDVWKEAQDGDGIVRDPLTEEVMDPNAPWDMGHKPGYEFRKHQQSAAERSISREQFLDEHNNFEHYRPELPSSNRSHADEIMDDTYFGD